MAVILSVKKERGKMRIAIAGCDEVLLPLSMYRQRPLQEGEVARSPGMKYRHYAPEGNVTIVKGGPNTENAKLFVDYVLSAPV